MAEWTIYDYDALAGVAWEAAQDASHAMADIADWTRAETAERSIAYMRRSRLASAFVDEPLPRQIWETNFVRGFRFTESYSLDYEVPIYPGKTDEPYWPGEEPEEER